MLSHSATLDVPRIVVQFLARLLAAHRRALGTPRGSRALSPFRQAVFVLRWFRTRGCIHCLARDAGISQATGYRYLHEGIDVLADQAPDLQGVLERCLAEDLPYVVLDGTLISCDRAAGTTARDTDLWYCHRAKRFAGNVQFLAAPDGSPRWVSDVEPGSVPDITAARTHALPHLLPLARARLPVLADLAYQGAGIGIRIPLPRHGDRPQPLDPDGRTYNWLHRHLRARGERAAAELKQRWRALQHVTLSPSRIGAVAKAALVLNNAWKS